MVLLSESGESGGDKMDTPDKRMKVSLLFLAEKEKGAPDAEA
jgi:hypothetical protein